jgi:hypothetical protein
MQQENTLADLFGEPIYSYTRQNALDDGVLIDVTEASKEAGFSIPVAVTSTVWDQYIEWTEEDSERQTYQDQSGRLWDVLWMARMGISGGNKDKSQIMFQLDCVPRAPASTARMARLTTLKMHIGAGDNHEPVVTIMLPDED